MALLKRDPGRGVKGFLRAGALIALVLLLFFGACVLFLIPRKMKTADSRRELMTRFMEQDYSCCDLSVARREPRCETILRKVRGLQREAPREFAVPVGNALARCPAEELLALAGEPSALHNPIPLLAAKVRGGDPAVAQKAARLLISDSTLMREAVRSVRSGTGPFCSAVEGKPGPSTDAARPQCPNAARLVEAVASLFADEREERADREKAAAMLTELGDLAAPALPVLVRALESRDPTIRGGAVTALTGMGPAGITALPALIRLAHREPLPGLRQQMLADLARIDATAGCCYALFQEPSPECGATLATIAASLREEKAHAPLSSGAVDCPAAQIIALSGTPQTIAFPMPTLAEALSAPDIETRRQAAVTVGLIAGTLHWKSRILPDVVSGLQGALRSGSPRLALDAAEALRQIDDPPHLEPPSADLLTFLSTLQDKTSDRRAAAAWALGIIGRPAARAVPVLRETLDGPDEVLADEAYAALNRIAVASGLNRLGFKRDGRYEVKPEAMSALLDLSLREASPITK